MIEEALKDIGTTEILLNKQHNSQTQKSGIYNHFMNGVNYMLPFVIAGGIIIALSFAFGITASDPKSDDYNVLAGALSTIGGLLAGYMTDLLANKINIKKQIAAIYQLIVVPLISILVIGLAMVFLIDKPIAWVLDALTSWLNGLGDTSGLMFGLLIGVMMAADMGGPINKSISTFSIGLMSAGVNAPIAACMAAGMTPPLGLALATILFKNKFTKEERTSGQSCWILGASYITEGAIPFAVADPIRVIPSLMLGSATAAGISMATGVTSMAPHGGIWVMIIPNVMNNLPMYLLAILAGTLVTAIAVGLLKKPVTVKDNKIINEVEI